MGVETERLPIESRSPPRHNLSPGRVQLHRDENEVRSLSETAEPEAFRWGSIDGAIVTALEVHDDQRGWLIELFRSDEVAGEQTPQMAYLSETGPGEVRGPHEHRYQSDLFVFVGPGDFELYLWDNRKDSPTYRNRQTMVVGESNKQRVIVPPGVVHAYKNISERPALVINAPNRLYAGPGRKEPVDEIRHEECSASPYHIS